MPPANDFNAVRNPVPGVLDDIDVVKDLLRHGIDIDEKYGGNSITILMLAAMRGDLAMTRLLIDRGADVNAKNKYDGTALMYAAANGHMELMLLLVDKVTDLDAGDDTGWTALMYAAKAGHTELGRMLIDKGATPDQRNMNGKTSRDHALLNRHGETARMLQEAAETRQRFTDEAENIHRQQAFILERQQWLRERAKRLPKPGI